MAGAGAGFAAGLLFFDFDFGFCFELTFAQHRLDPGDIPAVLLELRRVFDKVDYIALPTLKSLPPHQLLFERSAIFEARVLGLQNTVAVNFAGNPAQKACEASIVALQTGGPSGELGIICFPSFHTIWSVLSVVALWPFRSLRVPSSLLASLIVISTVTTGWHYMSDVFAGLLFAGISLACADRFVRRIE